MQKPGTHLAIEARSVKDPMCGVGQQASGRNAWINKHYRRFLVLDELKAELVSMGFEILEVMEEAGISVRTLSDGSVDDPCLIRILCKRS
ncbi:unnamed protein product [Chrysoparadoxa australica]